MKIDGDKLTADLLRCVVSCSVACARLTQLVSSWTTWTTSLGTARVFNFETLFFGHTFRGQGRLFSQRSFRKLKRTHTLVDKRRLMSLYWSTVKEGYWVIIHLKLL